MPSIFQRVIVIVLDGVGIGALPDAAQYGDGGSNTVGNVARLVPLSVPTLRMLGLGRVVALGGELPAPIGAFGKMAESSPGKDSVTGHWEMAGIVLERAFPTFPQGFPRGAIAAFERRVGRGTLGNVVASGTEIIARLGDEHLRTGKPIVYTSADSVFQIAAHEAVIPVAELYRICEIAFDEVVRGLHVGRVIARPFVGTSGSFVRTSNRRDFAMAPTGTTLLDCLAAARVPVVSIGKIADLFAGRGVGRTMHTSSDADGMDRLADAIAELDEGFIFVNLVDFDTQYGHRNDVVGFAQNLERFDARLAQLLPLVRGTDLLVVTADHGNDPSTPSTDHSREYVPLMVCGGVVAGADLGVRPTFADLGQTVATNFGVGPLANGASFLEEIVVHHS